MNKLTKIGFSALAGSLLAVSAQAGTLSVSGGASISISDGDVDNVTGAAAEGNLWTMGDSLTFTGSGEMDNGMTVSVSYELDDDEGDANSNVLDSYSTTISSDGMGTLTFAGHGGDGALSAIDDTSPHAYEESWDGVTNADEETLVGGVSANNMFTYVSPELSGATVTIGYVPGGDAKTPAGGYSDFAIKLSPEMVEGLTLGYGMGETEVTAGTTIDHQTMYAKYTYGSITVGMTMSEADGPAASNDLEFEAAGITYAVTDDFTVGYNQSTSDLASATVDQEAKGFSASYTSGGITVGGMMNEVDGVSHAAGDVEGYELNISFAF